MGKKIS